jgi:co-chaperonin GroES (HSP10)
MIPKKGQIQIVKCTDAVEEKGGILIPVSAKNLDTDIYEVVSIYAGCEDVKVGNRIIVEHLNLASTVKLSFDGKISMMVNESDVIAVMDDCECQAEKVEIQKADFILDDNHNALGDAIMIFPDKREAAVSVGGIIVPMKDKELQRSHSGVVVSIGEKAAKMTGITTGMVILYDYYGAFGHQGKYDMIRSENAIAIFSVKDYEALKENRKKANEF